MSKLPAPVKNLKSVKRQILKFRGINLTNNYTDGDMADCIGLTTDGYPYLTQRKGRTKVQRALGTDPETYEDYKDPTQIWEWDGKLVVIDTGKLYYDSKFICYVGDGQKQFAVVNTKLIIWPDKLMVDLTDNTYKQMDASMTTGSGVTFTSTTMTAPEIVKVGSGTTITCGGGVDTWVPKVWTFGTSTAAVEACWVDGAWDKEKLTAIAVPSVYWNYGTSYHVLQKGDIIIPPYTNGTFGGPDVGASFDELDPYPENTSGYYGIIGGEHGYYDSEYEEWGNEWAISGYGTTRVGYFYDAYQVGVGTKGLNDVFEVGDWITISKVDDGETKLQITAVESSKITFTPELTDTPSGTYSGVTVQKNVPDLAYICEHDNRLWGVSNKKVKSDDGEYSSRMIYASELGLPGRWWSYENDSGAYAVAVGSEGNFTGIVAYGGGVCCFKENRLHKIVGDYPSNYYVNEYTIAGIQSGSYRSTITVNEVLYYKGTHGMYAYTGGAPSRISSDLGNEIYTEAATGSDGQHLFVAMKDASGKWALWKYSLLTGFWVKESEEQVLAMTTCNASMYLLVDGGDEDNVPYVINQDNDEEITWSLQFKPFYEQVSTSSSSSSSYIIRGNHPRKIWLDLDMETGASIKVEMKLDNGEWKTVWEKTSYTGLTQIIPIVTPCTDKTELRLSGTGRTTIRDIVREFVKGEKI